MENKKIKSKVREGYAQIANQESSCCGPVELCCGSATTVEDISKNIGYTEGELRAFAKEIPTGPSLEPIIKSIWARSGASPMSASPI